MKFAWITSALLMLTSGIKLEQRAAVNISSFNKALPAKLTPEQEAEILEWVIDELGGGTITKKEAHDALINFLDKHNYPQPTPDEWEMLEAVFDYVDTSGDGEIDLKEFATAMASPPPE